MAKQIPPLTDKKIRNTKATGKMQTLFDGGGLYLEISATGSKLWRMKYRFDGKAGLLSFGKYPEVSLSKARQRRDETRLLIAEGHNPSSAKRAQKLARRESAENTFELIAREWLINKSSHLTSRTVANMLSMLETYIFPWIGKRPVTELKTVDFLEVLKRIEGKGVLDTLRKVRGYCSQIMRFAAETGRAESDPLTFSRHAFKTPKTRHLAAITEPKEVAKLLRMIDGYSGTFVVVSALKIAPYVFVRPGELRTMEWADVNFETSEWRYFIGKTETPHIVPLARQVVEILKELQSLTGNRKYVFPSERGGGRPMSDGAVLVALRSMGLPKDEMTGHGFRAMARTILDEVLGERVDLIEHQLGHVVRDPLGRAYNRTSHLPERKRMMQRWADYLDDLRLHG